MNDTYQIYFEMRAEKFGFFLHVKCCSFFLEVNKFNSQVKTSTEIPSGVLKLYYSYRRTEKVI